MGPLGVSRLRLVNLPWEGGASQALGKVGAWPPLCPRATQVGLSQILLQPWQGGALSRWVSPPEGQRVGLADLHGGERASQVHRESGKQSSYQSHTTRSLTPLFLPRTLHLGQGADFSARCELSGWGTKESRGGAIAFPWAYAAQKECFNQKQSVCGRGESFSPLPESQTPDSPHMIPVHSALLTGPRERS